MSAIVFMALFAPLIAPHSPIDQTLRDKPCRRPGWRAAATNTCSAPMRSAATSWSRLIYGARSACSSPCWRSVSAAASASIIGVVAGYVGGAVDNIPMRPVDAAFTFPGDPVRAAARRHHGAGPRHAGDRRQPDPVGELRPRHPRRGPGLRQRDFVASPGSRGCSAARIMLTPSCPTWSTPSWCWRPSISASSSPRRR